MPDCVCVWIDTMKSLSPAAQTLKPLRIPSNRFAGSRRVLATAVDDWLENLFALAPVRTYAYVQQYHNL